MSSKYATQADAKKAGWFSRRNQTSAAMMESHAKWRATKSKAAHRQTAGTLMMERADRTTAEQLRIIANRPGKSAREVARLTRVKGQVSPTERARNP